jgi:hypothetical protein
MIDKNCCDKCPWYLQKKCDKSIKNYPLGFIYCDTASLVFPKKILIEIGGK